MKWSIQTGVYQIEPKEDRILENMEFKDLEIKIEGDWNPTNQLDERMTAKISKEEFKSLFGPEAKPRKGDAVSIQNLGKKFKIKKVKKFKSEKKGKKNYRVELKSMKDLS